MALNSSVVITAGVVAVAYLYYRGRRSAPDNGGELDIPSSFAKEERVEARTQMRVGSRTAERVAERIITQANSGSNVSHSMESDSLLNADDTSRYGGEHANVY